MQLGNQHIGLGLEAEAQLCTCVQLASRVYEPWDLRKKTTNFRRACDLSQSNHTVLNCLHTIQLGNPNARLRDQAQRY